MPFRLHASPKYRGALPPVKPRLQRVVAAKPEPEPFAEVRSCRAASAPTRTPAEFEEVRGVHVYTYADRIEVSNGIYTTYRYKDRLAAAGARWNGSAWTLPPSADVRAILAPPPRVKAPYVAGSFDITDTRGT